MKKDIYKDLKKLSLRKLLRESFPYENKGLSGMIFGSFGSFNLGDEAILASELQELRKIENLKIKVVARYPYEVRRLHKVNSISYYNLLELVKGIIVSDFIVFGGGGIICKTSHFRGLIFQLYYLLLFILIPLLLGKKVFVVGIGFYDNANYFIKRFSFFLLKFTTFVSVRDLHSYVLLNRHNIKVEIFKDFAFNLSMKNRSKFIYRNFGLTRFKRNIGLSLRNMRNVTLNIKMVESACNYIKSSSENEVFWFFPLDVHPLYPNDLDIAKSIKSNLTKKERSRFRIVSPRLHPREMFGLFKKMDYFVAMRLHAMIFCYRFGINFEAIGYDKKCFSFLESVGKNYINIYNLDNSRIKLLLNQI